MFDVSPFINYSKLNKVKIITLSGGVIFLYKKLKRRDEL
jgi:hypothetical protein